MPCDVAFPKAFGAKRRAYKMTPSDHMSAWNGLYPWLDGSQLITCATMYYELQHTTHCVADDGCVMDMVEKM